MGATAPADAREARGMIRAGLGYLAAADPARLPAAVQAGCLRELEQDAAAQTAARAWMLHSAWARTATHPQVLAELAAGQVSESAGRLICLWTDKLPSDYREPGR